MISMKKNNVMIHTLRTAACLILLGCLTGCTLNKSNTTSGDDGLNIIFLIGDGMGVPQVSTAYYFGEGEPNFTRFRHIGFHQSWDLTHKVTDSAAGATAFSIGQKTYKRAIGVGIDSVPHETIMELLQKDGYKTGLVSLTTITHATPAAFYAHVTDRDLHDDIAAQLIEADVDFIAGGGRKYMDKRADGQDLYSAFRQKGYQVDTSALSAPDNTKRNAYFLAEESLPSKIEGREEFLPEATDMALKYLSTQDEPFFLMVEGSYIDWAGHAENAQMLIEEVKDFNKVLGIAMDFVEAHPNTLLVVTADHETGEVSLGKKYQPVATFGFRNEIPGELSVNFNSDQHSAELIPVFAMGPGAEAFQGIYQNKDIYHKIREVYSRQTGRTK